jgi:hydrogenase maturation protease
MTKARQRRIVIGIGNPDRGDDGAGWAVARELRGIRSASVSESDRGCERIPPFSTGLPLPPLRGERDGVRGAGRESVSRENISASLQFVRSEPAIASAPPPLPHAPLTPTLSPRRGGRGGTLRQEERQHPPLPADIEIVEHSGEATALLAHMEGAGQAFLIDACISGAPPGTIHRFDISSTAMPSLAPGFSTHGFGLAQAVELARALGRLPRQTIVYAIEAASFAAGAPLSPEVAAAGAEVVRRLCAEIACFQSPISQAPGMVVL